VKGRFEMSRLAIEISEDKKVFAPGETIKGTVKWQMDENPASLELSLFWYTAGKGTQDVGVVNSLKFDNPGSFGKKDFRFVLPNGPYSFSGKLISLIWALELTSIPSSQTERIEITVSPSGSEILLNQT
jgi:hypothetical protein